MKMSGADQALYPQGYFWVRYILPRVLSYPRIVHAMRIAGQMSLSTFAYVLRWGTDPTLVVMDLDTVGSAYGAYMNTTNIFIDDGVAKDFEGSSPMVSCGWYFFEVVVLHELAHYGDALYDNKPSPGETGKQFERLAFGREMSPGQSCSLRHTWLPFTLR